MNAHSHIVFRITTVLFALLLGAQCIWLLLAEFAQPGINQLPVDPAASVASAKRRADAAQAASIGIIRGDLWAESAFTYADLLWGDKDAAPNFSEALKQAHTSLDRALSDRPDQPGVWLLLAGLALRYTLPNVDGISALKMSYYTGPSQHNLLPLRLRIATHLENVNDIELQQMISRDLRLLVALQQKSAVARAYDEASPAGKRLIKQTVDEIGPAALGSFGPGPNKTH